METMNISKARCSLLRMIRLLRNVSWMKLRLDQSDGQIMHFLHTPHGKSLHTPHESLTMREVRGRIDEPRVIGISGNRCPDFPECIAIRFTVNCSNIFFGPPRWRMSIL